MHMVELYKFEQLYIHFLIDRELYVLLLQHRLLFVPYFHRDQGLIQLPSCNEKHISCNGSIFTTHTQ